MFPSTNLLSMATLRHASVQLSGEPGKELLALATEIASALHGSAPLIAALLRDGSLQLLVEVASPSLCAAQEQQVGARRQHCVLLAMVNSAWRLVWCS
jgi:hypothetical protein